MCGPPVEAMLLGMHNVGRDFHIDDAGRDALFGVWDVTAALSPLPATLRASGPWKQSL
jgi:hypothetical protein